MEKVQLDGFDETYITSNGEVYVKGELKNQYLNKDGYLGASVLRDGKWVTLGVQRLVALAFHREELEAYRAAGHNVNKLEANHIDLDKTNNHSTNIDWCTAKENNIHSFLMDNAGLRAAIMVTNLDGDATTYTNLSECAKHEHKTIAEVWKAIKWQKDIMGNKYYHIPSTGKILTPLRKTRYGTHYRDKAVNVLHIPTGSVSQYATSRKAAFMIGCPPSMITTMKSKEGRVRFLYSDYVVTDIDVDIKALDLYGQADAQKSKGLSCIAKKDKVKWEFKSITELVKSLKLSKKAVFTRLGKARSCEVDGWKIELL